MRILMILITLFAVNGCSSLSKEECAGQDWEKLGFSDAMRGKDEPKTEEYKKECSEHGLKIKEVDYMKGYVLGLKKHCVFASGFNRGKRGAREHSYCQGLNSEYTNGYKVGFKEYQKRESAAALKENLIRINGGKECRFASDCITEGVCLSGKCQRTNNSCSFNSDCKNPGSCFPVSGWTEYMDHVSVNVCRGY